MIYNNRNSCGQLDLCMHLIDLYYTAIDAMAWTFYWKEDVTVPRSFRLSRISDVRRQRVARMCLEEWSREELILALGRALTSTEQLGAVN